MAVVFNNDSYVVTIKTGTNPVEDWIELRKSIYTIIAYLPPDENLNIETGYLLELLKEMELNYDQVLKVFPRKHN